MDRKTVSEAPRLLPRKRLLIDLLNCFDHPLPKLQFQKLLFLYCQEPNSPSPYEFVPYKYGAFSFNSYADCRKLIQRGLLVDEDSNWQLTTTGRRFALDLGQGPVAAFVDRHRMFKGDALVAEAYRRYPYYAIRSEIVDRILRGDEQTRRRIDAARPHPAPCPLQTIGYEGRSLERYLNMVLEAGVTLLCDVRRNAASRKYGFAKSTLTNACTALGIRYEHIPELGISSERRRALNGPADYHRLFSEYEMDYLPRQLDSLATTVNWIRSGECVALTCYERDAGDCHRSRVARKIERRIALRSPIRHL